MNISCKVIISEDLGGFFSSYFLFKIIKIKLLQYCSEFCVPSLFIPTYSGESWVTVSSDLTLPQEKCPQLRTPPKRGAKKVLKVRLRSHLLIFQQQILMKYTGITIIGIMCMFFPSKRSALANQFALNIFMLQHSALPFGLPVEPYTTLVEFSVFSHLPPMGKENPVTCW